MKNRDKISMLRKIVSMLVDQDERQKGLEMYSQAISRSCLAKTRSKKRNIKVLRHGFKHNLKDLWWKVFLKFLLCEVSVFFLTQGDILSAAGSHLSRFSPFSPQEQGKENIKVLRHACKCSPSEGVVWPSSSWVFC